MYIPKPCSINRSVFHFAVIGSRGLYSSYLASLAHRYLVKLTHTLHVIIVCLFSFLCSFILISVYFSIVYTQRNIFIHPSVDCCLVVSGFWLVHRNAAVNILLHGSCCKTREII